MSLPNGQAMKGRYARQSGEWKIQCTRRPGEKEVRRTGNKDLVLKKGTRKPGTRKPGTGKPGTGKPGTGKPGTRKVKDLRGQNEG